jgi:hypothetical protein
MRIGLTLLATAVMASCSGPSKPDSTSLLEDLTNNEIAVTTRLQLIQEIPALVHTGELGRDETIKKLKGIIWMRHLPQQMRISAMELLLEPDGLLNRTQGVALVNGMMPTERNLVVRHRLSQLVVIRDWPEVTPALVRSFAVPDKTITDDDRPERLALLELHRDSTIEEIVFQTFTEQGEGGVSRLRRDSWNLLSRLDESGELRVGLLSALLDEPPSDSDKTLMALRQGLLELRTIPLTGEELEWLTDLHSANSTESKQWWEDVTLAVAGLNQSQRRGIRIRHLEALRWAAINRSEWVGLSREDLDGALTSRLESREHKRRVGDIVRLRSESIDTWRDDMAWADYITALVIDEAVGSERVRSALFAQAETDRLDETTEYGGIVRISIRPQETEIYVAADYPPKPVMRENDTSFVASPEMFREGTQALAHYHFHVQEINNGRYAGPSFGDMNYAARYGRACLVFTSLDENTLGVDLYQPDGVILDLGRLKRPTTGN